MYFYSAILIILYFLNIRYKLNKQSLYCHHLTTLLLLSYLDIISSFSSIGVLALGGIIFCGYPICKTAAIFCFLGFNPIFRTNSGSCHIRCDCPQHTYSIFPCSQLDILDKCTNCCILLLVPNRIFFKR